METGLSISPVGKKRPSSPPLEKQVKKRSKPSDSNSSLAQEMSIYSSIGVIAPFADNPQTDLERRMCKRLQQNELTQYQLNATVYQLKKNNQQLQAEISELKNAINKQQKQLDAHNREDKQLKKIEQIKTMIRNGGSLQDIDPEYRGFIKDNDNDRDFKKEENRKKLKVAFDIVTIAVGRNEDELKFAAGNIVLLLLRKCNNWKIVEHASEKLKDNFEFIKMAMEINSYVFQCATKRILGNRELIMEALRIDITAFKFASKELKSDKTFVDDILKNDELKSNGLILKYVDEKLQKDEKLLTQAEKTCKTVRLIIARSSF